MRPITRITAVALVLVASGPKALAGGQTVAPLTSNRPGLGDSESLVAAGAVQLEAGVLAERADEGERRWSQRFGQVNLRVGLTDRIEAFAAWDGLARAVENDAASGVVTGTADVRLGAKLAVWNDEHGPLALTLAPSLSLPVGADDIGSHTYDAAFRVMWARSLPCDWSLGGNLLLAPESDDVGRYWTRSVTLGVGRTLTGTLSGFAEVAAASPAARPTVWSADTGLAWNARPNVQWDVSAGRSAGHGSGTWFLSGGVTLRKPPRKRAPSDIGRAVPGRRIAPV